MSAYCFFGVVDDRAMTGGKRENLNSNAYTQLCLLIAQTSNSQSVV